MSTDCNPARGWNALAIDAADNVAVALAELRAGETARVRVGGALREVVARAAIPLAHKMALAAIPRGGAVVKYGAVIASATADIAAGEHVHVHNVVSNRARAA